MRVGKVYCKFFSDLRLLLVHSCHQVGTHCSHASTSRCCIARKGVHGHLIQKMQPEDQHSRVLTEIGANKVIGVKNGYKTLDLYKGIARVLPQLCRVCYRFLYCSSNTGAWIENFPVLIFTSCVW